MRAIFLALVSPDILSGGEILIMPNAKVLAQKKEIVAGLVEKLKAAQGGVILDYKGITVENDTKLRRELRNAGVEYAVVKNTLLRFASNEVGFGELDQHLNGTTAIAISATDAVAPARIICKFAKENDDVLKVKAGFVDGKVIDTAGVKALADLPSKEVLIAKALGGLNAPISGFVNVLNGNIRGLVVALNAIAEKQAS